MDALDRRLRAVAPSRTVHADVSGDREAWGSHAAWKLGERYLSLQDPKVRAREGRYYTPPALGRCLVEQAWRFTSAPGLVVDPACGSGVLLTAFVEHALVELGPAAGLRWAMERIRGTDLDVRAVELCNLALGLTLLPAWSSLRDEDRPELPRFATVDDGLTDTRTASVVIANPPFGRVRLSPSARAGWSAVLFGHAHRPTLFLAAAIRRLSPGGGAAFVLPASLVGGAYYQRLRAVLADQAPPVWLSFLADRSGVFSGGVLQESLLGVFKAREGDDPVAARPFVERMTLNGSLERQPLGPASIDAGPAPWLLPRSVDDTVLLRRAASMAHRLSDYGWQVATGPLVWNRHRDQLHPTAGRGRLPVIWAGDVGPEGSVQLTSRRELRWCSVRDGQDWLVLDRPAVLVQRTTAPEQPRRLVAGILDGATLEHLGGRVVVENHLNVCTPANDSVLSAEDLHAFLSGEAADRLYRCMTGSVAVSAFELAALPLPAPGQWR